MKDFIKKHKWIIVVGILALAAVIFLSVFLVRQHTLAKSNASVALEIIFCPR